MRAETGTMQFGDSDWRGVFIRGDNAFAYRLCLEKLLRKLEPETDIDSLLAKAQLQGLLDLLIKSDERNKLEKDDIHNQMKPFEECIDESQRTNFKTSES